MSNCHRESMLSTARIKWPVKSRPLSYRSIVLAFCGIIMSFAVITAFLNIIIDPMWCFSHENKLNAKQLAFAEREQKTNYLTYHHEPYNALLIGNSRVVYMDQNDFSGMSVFNYAVSAMVASEYAGYIGYARNVTSNHIKIVYIGLSFASVNDEVPRLLKQNPPAYFVGKATDQLNQIARAH